MTLPARPTVAVFAVTEKGMVPGPLPFVVDPTVIHVLVDTTVHAQVVAAARLPLKDPPAAGTVSVAGLIAHPQPCPGGGGQNVVNAGRPTTRKRERDVSLRVARRERPRNGHCPVLPEAIAVHGHHLPSRDRSRLCGPPGPRRAGPDSAFPAFAPSSRIGKITSVAVRSHLFMPASFLSSVSPLRSGRL